MSVDNPRAGWGTTLAALKLLTGCGGTISASAAAANPEGPTKPMISLSNALKKTLSTAAMGRKRSLLLLPKQDADGAGGMSGRWSEANFRYWRI
jgi:hypothetical protein